MESTAESAQERATCARSSSSHRTSWGRRDFRCRLECLHFGNGASTSAHGQQPRNNHNKCWSVVLSNGTYTHTTKPKRITWGRTPWSKGTGNNELTDLSALYLKLYLCLSEKYGTIKQEFLVGYFKSFSFPWHSIFSIMPSWRLQLLLFLKGGAGE